MNKAYLLTGGNVGNREENLGRARQLINERAGNVIKTSSLYQTAAWGKTNQAAFLNQALVIKTELSPNQLMTELLGIEKEIGRVRLEKYGPRVIDIDILLYGEMIVNEPSLTIPHPELKNRRFALAPLAQVAPDLIHPALNKPIKKLLEECDDKLDVLLLK